MGMCYTLLVFLCILESMLGSRLEVKEVNGELCDALNSIIESDVLTPPLSIQLSDQFFARCINTSGTPVLINLMTNETPLLSRSSVILVETKADVLKNLSSLMNYRSNHLIVVRRYATGDLDELVHQFWKNLFLNVSFLLNSTANISLQTFVPYNEDYCNDTILRPINFYDRHTHAWQTPDFFPKKLNNFYGCSIRIATHKNVIPYIVRDELLNGERVLQGRVIEMIDALASTLQFTADLDYAPSVTAFDDCYRKVANNDADLFIGNVAIDKSLIERLDFSVPIFFEFLKFVVPPGKTYTQMENFGRVFDQITWTLIIILFLLTGGAILTIVNFRSKKLKTYAFGVHYGNAFMDFVATIFGTALSTSPKAIVPRFLIVKFVLFCFIMRSIYQGSLYNFMQSGAKANPVQSIDEMIVKGFTFFMLQGYAKYLNLNVSSPNNAR